MPSSTKWGLLLLATLSCLDKGFLAQDQHGPEVQDKHTPSPENTPNIDDFSFSLYRQIAKGSNNSNIFFSPVSIATSLALLSLGARGETHHQIMEGMHFNLSQRAEADIHHGFQHLLRGFNQLDSQLQLNMGSGLFIQEGLKLAEKFLGDAKTLYHSEAFSTNFHNAEEAKKKINDYVEKGTQGKIVDLVQELDENTVFSLVNYIFFKGKWKQPFDANVTREKNFYKDEHVTIKVPMMSSIGLRAVQRSDTLSTWALMMDYVGNATAMFLLPDQGKMRHLEDTLTTELLDKFLEHSGHSFGRVYFPKMSISGSYDLIPIMKSLGISRIFTPGAELSGITEDGPLSVSQAVHKAVLKVDEEGTEAAGATSWGTTRGPLRVITFDRPFILIIIDNASQVPLFVGKVVDPIQA